MKVLHGFTFQWLNPNSVPGPSAGDFSGFFFVPVPSWISEALGEGVPVDLQFCDLERGTQKVSMEAENGILHPTALRDSVSQQPSCQAVLLEESSGVCCVLFHALTGCEHSMEFL